MRDDYVRALAEGRTAKIGTQNPYADGKQLAMAAMWTCGYNRMLVERFYSRPSMQPYLEARRSATESSMKSSGDGEVRP